MAGDGRRTAERFGRRAETAATLMLRLKGFRIVARRLRSPVGEIDVVARRGDILAIVEVKARAHREGIAGVLSARQRRRLERAAQWLVGARPELAGLACRFDLVLVAPRRLPRHIPDAWRPGD